MNDYSEIESILLQAIWRYAYRVSSDGGKRSISVGSYISETP